MTSIVPVGGDDVVIIGTGISDLLGVANEPCPVSAGCEAAWRISGNRSVVWSTALPSGEACVRPDHIEHMTVAGAGSGRVGVVHCDPIDESRYTISVRLLNTASGLGLSHVTIHGKKLLSVLPRVDGVAIAPDGAVVILGYFPGELSAKGAVVHSDASADTAHVLLRVGVGGIDVLGEWSAGGNGQAFMMWREPHRWLVLPEACSGVCYSVWLRDEQSRWRRTRRLHDTLVLAATSVQGDELLLAADVGPGSGLVSPGIDETRLIRVAVNGDVTSITRLGSAKIQSLVSTDRSIVLSGRYRASEGMGVLRFPDVNVNATGAFVAVLDATGRFSSGLRLASEGDAQIYGVGRGVLVHLVHRGPLIGFPVSPTTMAVKEGVIESVGVMRLAK